MKCQMCLSSLTVSHGGCVACSPSSAMISEINSCCSATDLIESSGYQHVNGPRKSLSTPGAAGQVFSASGKV